MTEVVVARKAEPVGKLVRSRKRSFSILGVPSQHKRELSPKDGYFKPAVEVLWLDKLTEAATGSVAVILALDAVAALFVGVSWGISAPATAPAFWSVYGMSQVALFAVPGLIAIPLHRGRKRNFKALVDWLGARYGIQLSAKQGLPGFVAALTSAARSRTFADVSGQIVTLNGSPDKGYWVVREDMQGEWTEYPRTAGAKAPQLKKAAVTSLPQQLRVEHEEVAHLISKLNQRDLSAESDHVVNRAERDLEKVLTLYADLSELNVVTDANVNEIEQVLHQLRIELTDVFQREAQWTLNALKIETTYVTSREERAGIKVKK